MQDLGNDYEFRIYLVDVVHIGFNDNVNFIITAACGVWPFSDG